MTALHIISTVAFLLYLAVGLHATTLNHKGAWTNSFLTFDHNEDGVVNGMELYSVLTLLDGRLGYTQSEARTIIQLVDRNKDDQLDRLELEELAKLTWTELLQH